MQRNRKTHQDGLYVHIQGASHWHHQLGTESSNWRSFPSSRKRYCEANQQQNYHHQQSQHNQYFVNQQSLKSRRTAKRHDNPRYSLVEHRSYMATHHNLTTGEYSQPNNKDKGVFQTRDQHSYPKIQHKQQHNHCFPRKGPKQAKIDSHLAPKQNKAIRTEILEQLPFPAEGVHAVYTNDPLRAEAWLRNHIRDESASAIGLDIEWKPQFKKKKYGGVENKTAVLQLAVEESCLVLHLCHMQSFPKSLATILGNKAILKVGSGILGDAVKLRKDCQLTCLGRADTQVLAKTCQVHTGGVGLKSLAKTVLEIDFSKPKYISVSNWEQFPLNTKQIQYAAMDAWISLKLFLHLKKLLKELKGISTVPCDLGEPTVHKVVACKACGKKCKGNDALLTHIAEYGHTRCGNCNKLFQTHVPQKHKKKCAGSS